MVLVREIQHMEPMRTSVLAGRGVHWTPRGWPYNVSGLDAVWVRLRGGRRFVLGTDQPEELAAAIEHARRAWPAIGHAP